MTDNCSDGSLRWFAINVYRNRVFDAERELADICDETFLPRHVVYSKDRKPSDRPLISRLMFVRTDIATANALDSKYRNASGILRFSFYRNVAHTDIQPIADNDIRILKIVCAPYDPDLATYIPDGKDYHEGTHVRIIRGVMRGIEGYIRRIKNNKRIIVDVQHTWSVILPFIPNVFIEKIND